MEDGEPNSCCRCSCCSSATQKLDGAEVMPIGMLERAEVEGEREALQETVESQQQTIQELCEELDEERNAASTAANEAMSMILRLQREKAEVQMEARQFQRIAEEKFEHDQREIDELEEELCKREEAIEALESEIRELRELLADTAGEDHSCEVSGDGLSNEMNNFELNRSGETPRTPSSSGFDGIEHIEPEFHATEGEPSSGDLEVLEKEVVTGDSSRGVSCECGDEDREQEEIPVSSECLSEGGGDDVSDRVYTIDAVHGVSEAPVAAGVCEGSLGVQRDLGIREIDVMDLYRRVQALEADRETMRRAIVNMKTEDTQLVLLREISRNLCKAMVQQTVVAVSQRQLAKERYSSQGFSFLALFKWLVSFLFFWKKKLKTAQSELPGRDMCGSSSNNISLFLLLNKSPLFQQL